MAVYLGRKDISKLADILPRKMYIFGSQKNASLTML